MNQRILCSMWNFFLLCTTEISNTFLIFWSPVLAYWSPLSPWKLPSPLPPLSLPLLFPSLSQRTSCLTFFFATVTLTCTCTVYWVNPTVYLNIIHHQTFNAYSQLWKTQIRLLRRPGMLTYSSSGSIYIIVSKLAACKRSEIASILGKVDDAVNLLA